MNIPPREDQHSRMAYQRNSKLLRSFNTQVDSIILYRRNRRLRNTGHLRKLILAHLLKLANDPN